MKIKRKIYHTYIAGASNLCVHTPLRFVNTYRKRGRMFFRLCFFCAFGHTYGRTLSCPAHNLKRKLELRINRFPLSYTYSMSEMISGNGLLYKFVMFFIYFPAPSELQTRYPGFRCEESGLFSIRCYLKMIAACLHHP